MSRIGLTINGKPCSCERGEMLLDVARREGFRIPTLCSHASLSEQGCCRVCLAEVKENGWSKTVVSCVYPLEKSCEVYTDSETIREQRAMVLMLLQARAPESPEIAALCAEYGAPAYPRLKPLADEKCILCGLCARACATLGTGAISTVGRGADKKVSTPYDEPNPYCVGCGSCASVCPTQAIPLFEQGDIRRIWGREFKLEQCSRCGALIGTTQEIRRAMRSLQHPPDGLCPACRQLKLADEMQHTFGVRRAAAKKQPAD